MAAVRALLPALDWQRQHTNAIGMTAEVPSHKRILLLQRSLRINHPVQQAGQAQQAACACQPTGMHATKLASSGSS